MFKESLQANENQGILFLSRERANQRWPYRLVPKCNLCVARGEKKKPMEEEEKSGGRRGRKGDGGSNPSQRLLRPRTM